MKSNISMILMVVLNAICLFIALMFSVLMDESGLFAVAFILLLITDIVIILIFKMINRKMK